MWMHTLWAELLCWINFKSRMVIITVVNIKFTIRWTTEMLMRDEGNLETPIPADFNVFSSVPAIMGAFEALIVAGYWFIWKIPYGYHNLPNYLWINVDYGTRSNFSIPFGDMVGGSNNNGHRQKKRIMWISFVCTTTDESIPLTKLMIRTRFFNCSSLAIDFLNSKIITVEYVWTRVHSLKFIEPADINRSW